MIAAANSIAGGIIYMFLGTSKEQSWNKFGKSSKQNGHEMQMLTAPPVIKSVEGDERIDVAEMNGMIKGK